MNWLKVWWHCLIKTFANLKGEHHVMCMYTKDEWHKNSIGEIVITKREIFRDCSCGFQEKIKTLKR